MNPIAVKCALNLLGHDVGGHRLPLVEATDEEREAVRGCLERLGLLASGRRVMARFDDMLAALGAGAAIPGVMGVGPGRTWDAVVAAHAPSLTGTSVTFVALEDGTLIVDEDVPDGSLAPLADSIEEMVGPPYRAAAARGEGDSWTAVAESVRIVALPGVGADEVELTVVDGVRTSDLRGGRDGSCSSRPSMPSPPSTMRSRSMPSEWTATRSPWTCSRSSGDGCPPRTSVDSIR